MLVPNAVVINKKQKTAYVVDHFGYVGEQIFITWLVSALGTLFGDDGPNSRNLSQNMQKLPIALHEEQSHSELLLGYVGRRFETILLDQEVECEA